MKTPRITLFIITKNEESKIAKCILSARDIVNEIVVVDSYSKDKTVLVCRELGAQVFEHEFKDFTSQKNYALSKAKSEWALSLDADEELTPELRDEILAAVKQKDVDGFELPRVNYFLGKRMRFGGIKKENILRLVRTEKAKYVGGLVHETLHVNGKVARLKNVFIHHSYDNIEAFFEKQNRYSTLSARTMHAKGKTTCLPMIALRTGFDFFRRYILWLGILDGTRGFIWAGFSSFYTLGKYAKLWYLNQKQKFF